MAFDSRGAHNSFEPANRGFFATIASLFANNECCSMRNHSEDPYAMEGIALGRPAYYQQKMSFPGPPLMKTGCESAASLQAYDVTSSLRSVCDASSTSGLRQAPAGLFDRLAELFLSDVELGQRIDVTNFIVRGEARSLKVQFLKACVRGSSASCFEIWARLSTVDRNELMEVYQSGLPSSDYFLNLVANDDYAGSECGSSSTDFDIRSDSTR